MLVARLQASTASGNIQQSLEAEQHEVWLFNSILLRKEVLRLHLACPIHNQDDEAVGVPRMQRQG